MRTLLVLCVLLPTAALADDIGPPPIDCPAGAVGRSSHQGEWCEPTTCDTDEQCGREYYDRKKRVCREQALCVGEKTEQSYGRHPDQQVTRAFGYATCNNGVECPMGKCVTAKRCVPIDTPLPEPTKPPPDPTTAPATTSAPATTAAPAPAPKSRSGCDVGLDSSWLFALMLVALRRQNASSTST